MKVAELLNDLESNKERVTTIALKDIELDDEGLKVAGEENPLGFDTATEGLLGQFLGISTPYLKKCPGDLKKANINHWLKVRENQEAQLHIVGNHLEGIHDEKFKFLPMRPTMERVVKVFDPEDEVRYFHQDKGSLHLDIRSEAHSIEVPGTGVDALSEFRPQVGDITHGGIRFFMYPQNEQPPKLQTFLERLWCTNGATADEPEFTIRLRGNTVDEVLAELETAAGRLLSSMPDRLAAYRHSSEIPIEGDLALFINQYGAERGISAKAVTRVLDQIPMFGEDYQATAYDITQLFTSLANDENVRYSSRLRLQDAGGRLSMNSQQVTHRCTSCERPL